MSDSRSDKVNGRRFVLGRELQATIWTTGAETAGRHDLTEGVQPPGAATPLHLHTRYDERFWVVLGSLSVWAGQEHVKLRSGDFYAVPMNVPHMLRAGPAGARAIQVSSPAAFADLVARTGTPAHLATAETELDMDLFMAVTTELGDIVLAPPGTTPAEFADQSA